MYYSLTFETGGVQKNTWADWRLIPDTPPSIPMPELNTNYVDIPGRSGGPLDLTGVPFNKKTYKRMTGSWNFLRNPDNRRTRVELYEAMRAYFIGNIVKVKFEEDLAHYYKGRFTVGQPATGVGPIKIAVSFDLEPLRYNVADDTVDTSYTPE